ncbi:GIY-YIG nuclease family protein [Proteobacteria bacterium 005FR1]|nr:GIY-YIG nuclease family protein [Proteobacteria bacterium 005FR1]
MSIISRNAIVSILSGQTEIREIDADEVMEKGDLSPNKKITKPARAPKGMDSEYAELLQLFSSTLNVKGRPFGQLNRPGFGISDGASGVQWNLSVSTQTGDIRLGVNLEGMTYNNWPISTFIQAEMKNPLLESVKSQLAAPENVFVSFTRDAWQVTSRPPIVEKYLGGKEHSLAEISAERWLAILTEALGCLSAESHYRSRAKQTVTLEGTPRKGEKTRLMEVSPHLRIWSALSLEGDVEENMKRKFEQLEPVYTWVKKASEV